MSVHNRHKYPVNLSIDERKMLQRFVSVGKHSAREFNRARILLYVDEGRNNKEISTLLGVSHATIVNVCQRFASEGVEALYEKFRSGQPVKITEQVKKRIRELANSAPPRGKKRWTLALLAQEAIQCGIISSISDRSIGLIIQAEEKNNISGVRNTPTKSQH